MTRDKIIEMLSYVLATLFLVGLAFDLEKRPGMRHSVSATQRFVFVFVFVFVFALGGRP